MYLVAETGGHMKKKLIASLMAVCMLLPLNTYATILHKIRDVQTVTQGVTLITDEILTVSGWQNAFVLKLDLSEQNLAIKPIGTSHLGEKETLIEMVQQTGAIAAINADFFSMTSNVPSFGPMISNGEIIQAYNSNQVQVGPNMSGGPMGTLIIDEMNNILMDYVYVLLEIEANGAVVGEANAYNKISTYMTRPIVLDSRYLKNTTSVVGHFKGAHTIVVEDDKVIYHAASGESVAIPDNGYVLMMDETYAGTYYHTLPIGTEVGIKASVRMDQQLVADIEDVALGIGAGGLLMKDGEMYQGASNIVSPTQRNPRSVVATTYNADELLLIALDGRGASIGATHSELVELLKGYGVKDALYLDGGGSTTLVARQEGEISPEVMNTPSDGKDRAIVNGIGVFTTQETGALEQLTLDVSSKRTFVGEPIKMTVKGTDSYKNPVVIPQEAVTYEVVGGTGIVENNIFYPETAGDMLVIAQVNGVEVATEVSVSEAPIGLVVEPALLNMNPQDMRKVQVYGVDADGYKLPVNQEKLVWEGTNGVVAATGQTLTAGVTGTTLLNVAYGQDGPAAKVSVVVGDNVLRVESFETYVPTWGGDTTTVTGLVQPCTDVKFEGERAVKMTYTFAPSAQKQVAYMLFEQPILLPNDANSFNIWVNGRGQGDTLKVEVVDANGTKHYLKLADCIDFTGWKYLSAQFTDSIAMPAQVTKIYAYAQSIPDVARTTALYFDHASITRGAIDRTGITTSAEYTFDPLYREQFYEPEGSQYYINVAGPTQTNSLKMTQETLTQMTNKLLSHAEQVILASTVNGPINLGNKGMVYTNTYQASVHNKTQVIQLGTAAGGLRKTDASQWNKLKATLETTQANHIIMVMSRNPLTQFDDAKEGQALHDYLVEYTNKTGKPIFIVTTGGFEPEVTIEESIRYIRVPGIVGPEDNLQNEGMVQFKIVNDAIYYTFENMIE